MVGNPAGSMIWLKISAEHQYYLGQIRHWPGLKIAKEGDDFWISGLSSEQADSLEVATIPFASLYRVREGLLFPVGSELPVAKSPKLFWSPIAQMLSVEFPADNFNYFGVQEKIAMKLAKANRSEQPFAISVPMEILKTYLTDVPAIRLRDLSWCVIGQDTAMILGLPVPSLPGETFWKRGKTLFPAGYDYQYPFFGAEAQSMLDPEGVHWVVWTDPDSYLLIPQNHFVALSRSAFHLTRQYAAI